MSLRWKLLRFQTAEKVLHALPPSKTESSSSHALLTGLPKDSPAASPSPYETLLRSFASGCTRASATHSAQDTYALALPKGVVEVFCLPGGLRDRADRGSDGMADFEPAHPSHFTLKAHESCVVDIRVVATPVGESPVVVTVGIDSKMVCVKLWRFTPVPAGQTAETLASGFFVDDFLDCEAPLARVPPAYAPNPSSGQQMMSCSATLRMSSESRPSCLAVFGVEDPSMPISAIAVGFDDASVVIFTGDLPRERFGRVRVAPAPGEMRDVRPITFLAYCADHILCVSEQSVAVLRPLYGERTPGAAEKKGQTPSQVALPNAYEREVLDTRGALEGNTVAHFPATGQIAVAREEALYFFNKDGRAQCFAFPSDNLHTTIAAVGPYLVHSTSPSNVVMYDLVTKVIAYRGAGDVSTVFTDNDRRVTIVIMRDMSIVRIEEVSLDNRVNTLLGRGMYSSAIALAKAEDSSQPSALFTSAVKQYSQFLMSKGDFDSASKQLVDTIGGVLEPSWVITRLVEQPGLRSGLRSYLEELHYKGKASFVHTRVLITCYRHDRARAAILQDRNPADDRTTDDYIIQVLSNVEWSEQQVDTAIDICLEAGLYGVAERVARKRERHVLLARTLVENLDDVPGGLEVMRSLNCKPEAFQIANVCGRRFLAAAPKEFVNLVANLLSSSEESTEPSSKGMQEGKPGDARNRPLDSEATLSLMHLAQLFVDRPRWLASLLEIVVSRFSAAESTVEAEAIWKMFFEALTRVDVDRASSNGMSIGQSALKLLETRTAKIDLRDALEISERYGHGPCLEYIYEHLRMYRDLSIHFRLKSDIAGMVRACRRHGKREPYMWLEAIRLIGPSASRFGADRDEAMPGIENGSVISQHARQEGVLEGRTDGSQRGSTVPIQGMDLMGALEEAMLALDSSGSLSAAEVVEEVCTVCPQGKWSLVQSYFERTVGRLANRAEEEEAASAALGIDALETRAETERLSEAVVVKATYCDACDDHLSFPSVHFFCGHSFHAACIVPSGTDSSSVSSGHGFDASSLRGSDLDAPVGIGESHPGVVGEVDCPLCVAELDSVLSMKAAVEEKNNRHDDFFRMLQGSKRDGGYETVMSFLSRNPFISRGAVVAQKH